MIADDLIEQIERADTWPPKSEHTTIAHVSVRRAFRQSDERVLRKIADWAKVTGDHRPHRHYITDPLPGLISRAFADLLFGDEPTIRAIAEADQADLDDIIETNQFGSELHRAARVSSSEGEVWWRIYVDKDISLRPMVQWISRLCVIPVFHGQKEIAAAFVSEIACNDERVWRHIEVQADMVTHNLLYAGTRDTLGTSINLDSRPETSGLPEVWQHNLPMLAGRILNSIDDDPTLGRSDYQGIERLLLSLNEAASIGSENARLTAKKRIFVTGQMIREDGTFDAGADVLIVKEQDGALGESGKAPPIQQVEYSFDASALIQWTDSLNDTILTRVGLAPELVGRRQSTQSGRSDTGTALRTKLLHTVLTANGKGRYWDDALPHILMLCALVDQLSPEEGGFGRQYTNPADPPAVARGDVLPHDDVEEASRHQTLVGAEIESRETAIRELHPEWTDDQVEQELGRIKDEAITVEAVQAPDVHAPVEGRINATAGAYGAGL